MDPKSKLRLWPGIAAVIVLVLVRYAMPIFAPDLMMYAMLGGIALTLLVLLWWAFFSRVPHLERWGAFLVIAAALFATRFILDKSIATGGMGMLFWIFVPPGLALALVAWAIMAQWLGTGARRLALVALIFAACGFWALMRTEGITGEGTSQLAWRWTETPEEKLLARPVEPPAPPEVAPAPPKEVPATPVKATPPRTSAHTKPEWPGFRGPQRDDVVTGVRIRTDWTASPPVEVWRRPIGPGWSSFAIGDGLIYTQEQRGDFEVVSCYKESTGKPVWTHRDAARFWESNGGPGPRATPALHDGRVYTLGATGILNALDAATGAVLWTRNAATDTGAKLPGWGFSGSPVVADDVVIVAASGRLAGYDAATGNRRWMGPRDIGGSYSSPHLLTIAGVPQVVMMTSSGATSVAPSDGKVLWKHAWEGSTIIQPAVISDGSILISTGDMAGGVGTRRLAIASGPDGWKATEVWTSNGLKPYFNDMVVHDGHAYGFDGGILACIDLQDGKRTWKGGRYGHGQLLLLKDQGVLLVLSEEGEMALVAAVPDQFREIAKFPALEGKTWNHAVLSHDLLLVRNGQEMVVFRLPLAGS